jgi:hypothetical protein
MVIIYVVLIGVIATTKDRIGNVVRGELEDSAVQISENTASDMAEEFRGRVDHWQGASVVLASLADTAMGTKQGVPPNAPNNVPQGYTVSNYWDRSISTIANTPNPRCGGCLVNADHSDFYLKGVLTGTQLNSTLSNQTTLDLVTDTARLDTAMKTLWKSIPEALQVYVGAAQAGLFRRFPGQPPRAGTSYADGSYDPAQRGWFTQAMNADRNSIITPPYLDAGGNGWMVTVAMRIGDSNAVVAADIKIKSLQDEVLGITLQQSGFVSLALKDGTVVADKRWQHESATGTITMANVAPGFNIQTGESGSAHWESQDGKEWIVAWSLTPHHVFYTWVPEDEAMAPAKETVKKVKSTTSKVIGSSSAIFAVTVAAVALFVFAIITAIMRPFNRVIRVAKSVVSEAGDISIETNQDMQDLGKPGGGLETSKLSFAMKGLITGEGRRDEKSSLIKNSKATKSGDMYPPVDAVAFPHEATYPTAPPSYNEVVSNTTVTVEYTPNIYGGGVRDPPPEYGQV